MVVGTNYFPSRANAISYYRARGEDEASVDRKIAEGLIHLRTPPGIAFERLWLIDGLNRWGIFEGKGK